VTVCSFYWHYLPSVLFNMVCSSS